MVKGSVWETVFRKVKYGWWSDKCLVKMHDLGFIVDLVSLQSYMILKYKKIPQILLFQLFSKGLY